MNAFYVGCLPQCILLFMDHYKGVSSWDFVGYTLSAKGTYEANDSIFKHKYGNTLFATTSLVFYFSLILVFLIGDRLFEKRGMYCKRCHVLCCTCPQNCINYADPALTNSSSEVTINKVSQSSTEIYVYKKERKTWLIGNPVLKEVHI